MPEDELPISLLKITFINSDFSEFMSTLPSDATRINKTKAALPEAMKYYKN